MFLGQTMDAARKLQQLSSQMGFEPAEDLGCPKLRSKRQDDIVLSSAALPNGKRITLLKTLLTSACERDCYYCPFRAGRDFRRATLSPDEMAGAILSLHHAGIIQGAFLSSGIAGGSVRTQDRLIATAEILRAKYHFQGYLHLKLMPGAELAQVERAMQLANRVSLNLEAPNSHRLSLLAPQKEFAEELIRPLKWVDEIRRNKSSFMGGWNGRWPSMTTQFVVGAVGESDLELLSTTESLYKMIGLARVYYSAFNPVSDTPFESQPPASSIREHRLYQASFLLRDYGFDLEDIPFESSGNLPLDEDPKLAWARKHLSESPTEINRASRHELLRIPGIGLKGAKAIISARLRSNLRELEDLHKIGIDHLRAAPFILLDGKRPSRQMSFWQL